MGKMIEALMTAFGTASSSATLPVTISCLEDHNKVNRNVVRFCVPIGATINMDGTALYEAVAALFIAQSRGLSMDFVKVIIVSNYSDGRISWLPQEFLRYYNIFNIKLN